MAGGVKRRTEAGIKPGFAVLGQHAGIKLRFIPGTVAKQAAVLIVHMAVKLIFTGRRVTNSDRDVALLVQHIIEVGPSVRTLRYIRGIKAGFSFPVVRVICLSINDAFIAPVGQVVHRSRPADIVVDTEHVAVERVM